MKRTTHTALHTALRRRIDKALHRYRMIDPHDRIILGLSGGKDSLTLTHFLAEIRDHGPNPFELEAVHVESELSNPRAMEEVAVFCKTRNVHLTFHKIDLRARLKEGRTFNCYWCATQRRTELLRLAEERGARSIALGHHMDDILETFFMNMTHKGELSTMLPTMHYDKYPVRIIRPLAWVEEDLIRAFARESGWDSFVCTCGFDTTSKRRVAREMVESIVSAAGAGSRRRMFESLHNVNARYLIHDEVGAPSVAETELRPGD